MYYVIFVIIKLTHEKRKTGVPSCFRFRDQNIPCLLQYKKCLVYTQNEISHILAELLWLGSLRPKVKWCFLLFYQLRGCITVPIPPHKNKIVQKMENIENQSRNLV